MRGITGGRVGITAALLTIALPASAFIDGQQTGDATAQDASVIKDDPSAALLTTALRTEIGTRGETTAPADLEALIVFVVSQGQYSDATVSAALNALSVNAPQNLRIAIGNVRLALLKRGNKRGTAAIVNGGLGSSGSAGSGGGEFTAPGISTGGGSSNYS